MTIADVLRATPLQCGILALSASTADAYVIQLRLDLDGRLDAERLRSALALVAARHPVLTGRFVDAGVAHPVHLVPDRGTVPLREAGGEAEAVAADERALGFDVRTGPLLRAVLVRGATDALILTGHHIALDGWSFGTVVDELQRAYSGSPLAEAPSFREYLHWLDAQDEGEAATHWRRRLGTGFEPLLLAERGPEAGAGHGGPAVVDSTSADPAETEAILAFARATGVTLSTLAQLTTAVVLSRLTDRSDVVFGTTVSGRPAELDRVAETVGLFITTVPVRVVLDPLTETTAALRTLQGDFAHDVVHAHPGLRAIAAEAGARDLFDTLLVVQNAPVERHGRSGFAPDASVVGARARSLTHYPLVLAPAVMEGRLVLDVEVRAEQLGRLDAPTVGSLWWAVLREIVGGARPLRAVVGERPEDRAATLAAATSSERTVVDLLEAAVDADPHADALAHRGRVLSYGELDGRANAVAHRVLALGLPRDSAVAVRSPRGIDAIVGILGVVKAGAAAVYLDPAAPPVRERAVLRVADVRAVVGEPIDGLPHVLPDAGGDTRRPGRRVHPDDALYVVFTSGSTGEPKGVVATHRGIVALHADHAERAYSGAAPGTLRVGHGWSLTFDASWQPLLALFSGHAIELLDAESMRDPARLAREIEERRIDVIEMSPSLHAHVSAEHGGLDRLRVLGLGGEAVGRGAWARLSASPTRAMNFYGPTETTVDAVSAVMSETPDVVLGRPVAGMTAHVLDRWLRPVPVGGVGELYLGGPQLTRGYASRPALTAERFVADPLRPGERMYRTADVVRRRADGRLEYLGRSDDQVKIRGHRVELGEVTAAVRSLDGVREAAVLVWERPAGRALRAFVVPDGPGGPVAEESALRTALAAIVPAYLVPARFTVVEALPLTPHGKLDAAALLALPLPSAPTWPADGFVAALLEAATAVVGSEPGLEDNLLDLGLDSIGVLVLCESVRRAGFELEVAEVLAQQSIGALAGARAPAVRG